MRHKRLAGSILAFALMAAAIPAQAAELDPATALSDAPEILSVTIPAEIPIGMDAQGNISVGAGLEIVNGSTVDVKIDAISVQGHNGWEIVGFQEDFSEKAVGTKALAFSFRGDATQTDGSIALTDGQWTIEQGGRLDIQVEAKLPRQKATSDADIAAIRWSVSKVEAVADPDDSGETVITSEIGQEQTEEEDAIEAGMDDGSCVDDDLPVADAADLAPGTSTVSQITAHWDELPLLTDGVRNASFTWADGVEEAFVTSLCSSDSSIAVVSGQEEDPGEVRFTVEAVSIGSAVIECVLSDGATGSFVVTVAEDAASDEEGSVQEQQTEDIIVADQATDDDGLGETAIPLDGSEEQPDTLPVADQEPEEELREP